MIAGMEINEIMYYFFTPPIRLEKNNIGFLIADYICMQLFLEGNLGMPITMLNV